MCYKTILLKKKKNTPSQYILYKLEFWVNELVPLKTLFGGFKGKALIKLELIKRDSRTLIFLSPSQAIKPILAPILSTTFKLFKVIVKSLGILCKPS